jgi:quinolinate synthase
MGVAGVCPGDLHQLRRGHQAFVGERGGIVCTSSNAAATLEWAWERKEKILFLPDQHLGRNTAFKMGVPLDEMVVWDPTSRSAGSRCRDAARARALILWKGHCSVHVRFTVQQIEVRARSIPACASSSTPSAVRRRAGGRRLRLHRVHPEDRCESARRIDLGRRHRDAPRQSPGRRGGARAHRLSLDQFGCLCSTMFRVSPNHLLWVLEGSSTARCTTGRRAPRDRFTWARSRSTGCCNRLPVLEEFRGSARP